MRRQACRQRLSPPARRAQSRGERPASWSSPVRQSKDPSPWLRRLCGPAATIPTSSYPGARQVFGCSTRSTARPDRHTLRTAHGARHLSSPRQTCHQSANAELWVKTTDCDLMATPREVCRHPLVVLMCHIHSDLSASVAVLRQELCAEHARTRAGANNAVQSLTYGQASPIDAGCGLANA